MATLTEPMFCRTPVDLKDAVEAIAREENWSIAYAHAVVIRLGLDAYRSALDGATLVGDELGQ